MSVLWRADGGIAMAEDTKFIMDVLRSLATGTIESFSYRIAVGTSEIKAWSAQAGNDDPERRRMLEALDSEIASMTGGFWEVIQSEIAQQLGGPLDEPLPEA
jgi:hypothetical protein